MPISLSCGCGRALKLRDEYAGKRIRCPDCKNVLAVPESDDVETSGFVVEESPKPTAVVSAKPAELPQRPRPSRDDDDDDDDRPRKKKRKKLDSDPLLKDYYRHVATPRRRSGSGIAISRSIIAGVLIVVFAGIWLVVGLFFGWLFIRPLVLIVIGMIAVGKGLMGYGDD